MGQRSATGRAGAERWVSVQVAVTSRLAYLQSGSGDRMGGLLGEMSA